jgi:hypothetical protein
MAVLAAPFLVAAPATFLATFWNLLARGSWESPWALLDGNYGTGVVASLSDRLFFNDSAGWGQPSRYPIIWYVVLVVAGVIYLARFRVAFQTRTPQAAVAFVALGLTLFLLLSRGFSTQFIVWILPLIVLVMPGLDGAILAVILTADTFVLEGYVYTTLFPALHRLLWVSVTTRTILLLWFAIECSAAIDPAGWKRFRIARDRATLPVAIVAVLVAGALVAVGWPYVADAAQAKFGAPRLRDTVARLPENSVLVFTQPATYDRLATDLGNHRFVVAAEPKLASWTAGRSLYRQLDAPLRGVDAVVITDPALPPGPLLDPVNQYLAARYGAPSSQDVDNVHLTTYDPANRPPEHPLDLTYGGAIRLSGVSPDVAAARRGSSLSLTLHWTTSARLNVDYTVSVQLLDPTGHLVAQHDSMPVDNTLPTSAWNPGEEVLDTVPLPIPSTAALGNDSLIVVVYDHRSQARLPVRGSTGQGDHGLLRDVMIQS